MPPPGELRAQLQKLLDSQTLAGSEQLKRLLQTVVERTTNGQAGDLKEYTLGVEAFGRPVDYDPKIDPIVRVQARRLRAKLDEYYATEGAADPLRITMPKGGYAPAFEVRGATVASRWRPKILAVGGFMIAAGLAGFAFRAPSAADPQSVAVLPLRNIGSDPAVAEQATEALITSLAGISSLRVASGTTTRSVADKHASSLPEMANALHVRWVVEGAVGEEDGRVVLKMRLVDATSDRKIWADTIWCARDAVSTTQHRTATAIAAAIGRVLAQQPRSTGERPRL